MDTDEKVEAIMSDRPMSWVLRTAVSLEEVNHLDVRHRERVNKAKKNMPALWSARSYTERVWLEGRFWYKETMWRDVPTGRDEK